MVCSPPLTSRLTLNLGLRWEYTQPIHELHNLQSNFYGTYAGMNQGTGVLLIPSSQTNFPIAANLATTLAADNIAIQYTSNDYLVNPDRINFAPRVGIAFMVDPKTVPMASARRTSTEPIPATRVSPTWLQVPV